MTKIVIRNVGFALELPANKEIEVLLPIVKEAVEKIIGRKTKVTDAEFKTAIQESIPYSQAVPDDFDDKSIERKRRSSEEWLDKL